MAREEAETRRRVAQESRDQIERYLSLVKSRAKDARIAFARISEGSLVPLVLPPLPPSVPEEVLSQPIHFLLVSSHGSPHRSFSTAFEKISSQAVHFPPYLLILFQTPTICRQMLALRDREHPASMLIQHCSASSQAIEPTLMSNSGENLGHLTLSRYVFIFLLSMSPIDY
jgi:hypothetical protein